MFDRCETLWIIIGNAKKVSQNPVRQSSKTKFKSSIPNIVELKKGQNAIIFTGYS